MSEELDNQVMLALKRMLHLIDQEIEVSERVCAARSESEFLALVQEQATLHTEIGNARTEYEQLRERQKKSGI